MKVDFLHTDPANTRLILIFTGWSAGPESGQHVSIDGWDVAVAHDFTELDFDSSILDGYYTVYLFAWSLGVFAAEQLLPPERITSAFALNGTLKPVDDSFGIPAEIYKGTADGLTERNLQKFRLRMAGDRETYERMMAGRMEKTDDIDNLRRQLFGIAEFQKNTQIIDGNECRLPWTRAYLSTADSIFPIENMKRHWLRNPDVEIVELDAPHYVGIETVVNSVIADTRKVSRRFTKAGSTYDTHAIAQYTAAIKLTSQLLEYAPKQGADILEIGCGTGLLTREYAPKLSPRRATFVDITQTGPFAIAPEEEYVIEDAERWISRETRQWDVILSGSTIQWFADIAGFLHLCHKRLRNGGILAISTFSPGNMSELDAVRPSPLIYPSADSLKQWLERDFEQVMVVKDEIIVEFQSVRDMLMHLKHTGVGGSAPRSNLTVRDMSHIRALTYRPIYITARKS